VDIKELSVSCKGQRRQVNFNHADGCPHTTIFFREMLRVTLVDGSVYAFDISSAQYGHYEPVIPWDQYMEQRVTGINVTNDFGDQKRVLDTSFKASDNTMQAAVSLTHSAAVKRHDDSIDALAA
jgi:hypothetical protein